MRERYSRLAIGFLLLLGVTLSPLARSDDAELWPEENQFSHPYSFVSPVVVDDLVYMTRFDYQSAGGWRGQLHKFRLSAAGLIVDKDAQAAFDCSGNMLTTAHSFWSSAVEKQTTENDINAMLAVKASRRLLTNSDQNDREQLVALPEDERKNIPLWLGDNMHAQPRVLLYGQQHKVTDRRLLLGTNSGLLHLFQDRGNAIDESWAFIPAEFLSRFSVPVKSGFSKHQYGLDGAISVFHDDKDRDGVIESDEGDRLWIFFGLRQGGRSYYALDLTEPDHPVLKWMINGNASERAYKFLGETWSAPQLAYLSAHKANASPVLVVGGGYDPRKDNYPAQSVQVGNAIYIIDADSGDKLFSISPDADSLSNLQAPFTEAIPADVALLDSDMNGSTDRLYVGDTGGNVWRLDMSGNFADWRITKLAELGRGQNENITDDRRFFGQPVIVRSLARMTIGTKAVAEVPADWILLGSGDRVHPKADGTGGLRVQNRYFALPDRQVTPYTKSQPVLPVLKTDSLQSVSLSASAGGVTGSAMPGWYLDLASQEKVFGNGYVVAGTVWFTSFSPADSHPSDAHSVGVTRLYRVNLQSGAFDGTSPVVKQYHDQLLENPGVVYQTAVQQLSMVGLLSDTADNNGQCSRPGVSFADAIQPRKISEYQTEY